MAPDPRAAAAIPVRPKRACYKLRVRPREPLDTSQPPSRFVMKRCKLSHLSDESLLRGLASLVAQDRVTTADMLAHIAEVDERRLYATAGYPSMFLPADLGGGGAHPPRPNRPPSNMPRGMLTARKSLKTRGLRCRESSRPRSRSVPG